MALLAKKGYGQVEPNHLSAQRTGQIYAQLPADEKLKIVENGMFLKYDLAAGKISATGEGEPMLVFSEIKLYDSNRQAYKDFALKKEECVDGKIYPRLLKTNVGDIFTTNLVDVTSEKGSRVGKKLVPGENGILKEKALPDANEIVFAIVKETTMADGQEAVKVQRIA